MKSSWPWNSPKSTCDRMRRKGDQAVLKKKQPDEIQETPSEREVCVCFHVPLNKLAKYVRLENPKVASQLSECYGAGTGCGWCIPFLEKIFEQVKDNPQKTPSLGIDREEYLRRRKEYHKKINANKMRDE